MIKQYPAVGQWYKDLQADALFEVVAWDIQAKTVELQYLDGEIAEYDLDGWSQLELASAAAPEDWRSAYELDSEDGIDPDLPIHPNDWMNPLQMIEPDTMIGVEDF